MKPSTLSPRNWNEAIRYLGRFLRNPIEGMKRIPDWDWPTVVVIQVVIAIIVGIVVGLFSRNWFSMLLNAVVFPISTLLSTAVGAAFFYYTFLFLFQRKTNFHTHYIIVALAYIPFLIVRIASPIGPPVVLIGFAMMAILLTVGLVENFDISKKRIIKLISVLSALFVIVWGVGVVRDSKDIVDYKKAPNSKNLDTLQKEMGGK